MASKKKAAPAAASAAPDMGEIRYYPLDKTVVGPENTRKSVDLGTPIDELATSIASVGLLQPLIGTDWGGEARIVGGQRRWLAMQRLVTGGKMAKDAPIPVRVMDHDRAHEASLAENFMRQQMNTQDLYLALKQLADAKPHAPLSVLADAFAISEDRARRILRLANLAPEIMAAWSDGKINTERAQAYAFTDKQEVQLEVFNGPEAQYHADHIRRQIQRILLNGEQELLERDRKALDLDEYKRRGGEVETDLFGDSVLIKDVALAREILAEQMNVAVQKLLASITYSDGTPIEVTVGELPQVNRYGYEQDDRDLFVDVADTFEDEAGEERAAEIEQTLEEDDELPDENREALEEELASIPRRRIVSVDPGTALIAEAEFDWYGNLDVTLAQVSREAAGLPAIAPPTPVELKVGANSTGNNETDAKITDNLSQRTLNILKGMRQAAIRRGLFDADETGEVAADAHLALIFTLAREIKTSGSRATGMVHNCAGATYHNTDYKAGLASFDGDWLSEPDHVTAFTLFKELTPRQVDEIAADIFGRKVEGGLYREGERTVPNYLSSVRSSPFMARRVMDLDAAFFGMFKKKQLVGFFAEALGDKLSDTFRAKLEKAKSASLIEYATKCFNPDGNMPTIKLLGLTPHVALLRDWVPSWLRFDGVAALAEAKAPAKTEQEEADETIDECVEELEEAA